MLNLPPLLLPRDTNRNRLNQRKHRIRSVLLLSAVACFVTIFGVNKMRTITHEANLQAEKHAEEIARYLRSDAVSALVKERENKIGKEIAQLPKHEWAGSYIYSGTSDVSVYIAPKAGFAACNYSGCMGLNDQNYGLVSESESGLELHPVLPSSPYPSDLPRDLVPVRWGKRHYLVETDRLVDFCNEVNSDLINYYLGFWNQHGYSESFLLRDGDEKQVVAGLPDVPENYKKYLLPKPVLARVEQVHEVHGIFPFKRSSESAEIVVNLNVGTADGILPGMIFYLSSLDKNSKLDLFYEYAVVRQVEEHTCRAVFSRWETKTPIPTQGSFLSTRSLRVNRLSRL